MTVANEIDESFLFSHGYMAMPQHYVLINNLLKDSGYNVTFRQSKNGVPHLVVHTGDNFSICFFKGTKTFRVFTPYGQLGKQTKMSFSEPIEILEYIKSFGKKGGIICSISA